MNTSNTSSVINRRHWIVAAMLAAFICGVSCSEEATYETNHQKLLALCKAPKATPKAIETLLKAGADIEARARSGKTPLIVAASFSSNSAVIEALLKAGANAKAKDKGEKTAVDCAKENEKIYKTKIYWKLHQAQYE